VNHGSKSLVYRENVATRSHEVKPGIVREIIDKYNIIAKTPFEPKGAGPHTSEWIKSNGCSETEVLVG
jgi:hypothetical protein